MDDEHPVGWALPRDIQPLASSHPEGSRTSLLNPHVQPCLSPRVSRENVSSSRGGAAVLGPPPSDHGRGAAGARLLCVFFFTSDQLRQVPGNVACLSPDWMGKVIEGETLAFHLQIALFLFSDPHSQFSPFLT